MATRSEVGEKSQLTRGHARAVPRNIACLFHLFIFPDSVEAMRNARTALFALALVRALRFFSRVRAVRDERVPTPLSRVSSRKDGNRIETGCNRHKRARPSMALFSSLFSFFFESRSSSVAVTTKTRASSLK